ncbi:MAG TPA: GNAT family protein [Actinomycetota bacterium]|nr:GNAT family protein [Actinomycetota bacterium]
MITPVRRPVELTGERCRIRDLRPSDADDLLALRERNRSFFEPFEPALPPDHFTRRAQLDAIVHGNRAWDDDREYTFGVTLTTGELVGRIRLSVVVRGPWQNANIGYYVDRDANGRGICTEGVGLVVGFAFDRLGLHRVQAGVMPRNTPSIRVLEKNGFRREGLAPRYLRINGEWEDHLIFARTVEDAAPA